MVKFFALGVFRAAAVIAVMAAVLFGCAGRWDVPQFWAYLCAWAAAVLAGTLVADPTLAKERWRPGPGGKDYLSPRIFMVLWLGQFVVAGLDVGRFHWTDEIPWVVIALGLVMLVAGLAVQVWAVAVNRFFSSVIRIQTDRGHQLVTSGPYRFVRHPAYAAAPLIMIGGGLALGSWLATIIGALIVPALVRRTALEDRTLREQLEGYADYAQKVRYRLAPGIW
jgi:protein-S-isoprenylcysteine O-methyltransferase Ste14